MNAPLIVVQGDLLLPTMYPMASMPFAAFGEEWILNGTRPALTEYEIPFYAARFITAYISGLTSRDDRFPYTPSSLWGNFKRNDPVDQPEQRYAANLTPEVAEPPPFAFEPFTAPEEHRAIVPPPSDRRARLSGPACCTSRECSGTNRRWPDCCRSRPHDGWVPRAAQRVRYSGTPARRDNHACDERVRIDALRAWYAQWVGASVWLWVQRVLGFAPTVAL